MERQDAGSTPAGQSLTRGTANDEAEIQSFVQQFLACSQRSDYSEALGLYADQVEFYDKGRVPRAYIEKEIINYRKRWPEVSYELASDIAISRGQHEGTWNVEYEIRYVVKNPGRDSRSGRSRPSLVLQRIGGGLKIIGSKETILHGPMGGTATTPGEANDGAPSGASKLSVTSAQASSVMPDYIDRAKGLSYNFAAEHLVDGDLSTCWQAQTKGTGGRGQVISLQLDGSHDVNRVDIANGFQGQDQLGDLFTMNNRIRTARLHFDDGGVEQIAFGSQDRGWKSFQFGAHRTALIRIEITDVWPGSKWPDLSVSEVAVYGN